MSVCRYVCLSIEYRADDDPTDRQTDRQLHDGHAMSALHLQWGYVCRRGRWRARASWTCGGVCSTFASCPCGSTSPSSPSSSPGERHTSGVCPYWRLSLSASSCVASTVTIGANSEAITTSRRATAAAIVGSSCCAGHAVPCRNTGTSSGEVKGTQVERLKHLKWPHLSISPGECHKHRGRRSSLLSR